MLRCTIKPPVRFFSFFGASGAQMITLEPIMPKGLAPHCSKGLRGAASATEKVAAGVRHGAIQTVIQRRTAASSISAVSPASTIRPRSITA
jgi:hypothetical protein